MGDIMNFVILMHSTQDTINIMIAIGFLLISYLIGSIPNGIIIGKLLCGIDIREHGSKNIGSTNAIRVLGKKVGFLVFFLDVFKGMVMIIVARILHSNDIFFKDAIITNNLNVDYLIIGVSAIIGHSFSIFIGFKGGKAVATSLGVISIICPIASILCLITFVITLFISGFVSLASTFAAITVTTTMWIFYGVGVEEKSFLTYFISKQSLPACIIVSIMALLIIIKHRKNYIRLLNGTENNFKKAKLEKKKNKASE